VCVRQRFAPWSPAKNVRERYIGKSLIRARKLKKILRMFGPRFGFHGVDPFRICRALSLSLSLSPKGTGPKCLFLVFSFLSFSCRFLPSLLSRVNISCQHWYKVKIPLVVRQLQSPKFCICLHLRQSYSKNMLCSALSLSLLIIAFQCCSGTETFDSSH
jgi:hypothetical protein